MFRRFARVLGSLPMAVLLLPTFAGVLALGTLVESAHGGKVAQQLVYQSWWFITLLGLLGVNIFFAAAKKWPWKKHQTGFLITHVGLLTLVAGGVVTSLGGVHGVMPLVDSDDARFHRVGLPVSNVILEPQRDVLRVERHGQILHRRFEPGPFAWRRTLPEDAPESALAVGLDWLAHPWPRSWSMDLGQGARLDVLDFYPHALGQPFAPTSGDDPYAFPALAVELASAATGILPAEWLGFKDRHRSVRIGPGLVELLGRRAKPGQLAEFQKPPAATEVGKHGTLVLGMGGRTFRWNLETLAGKEPESLGDSGWSLKLTEYLPNYQNASTSPTDPGLSIELSRAGSQVAGSRVRLALTARQAGELFPMAGDRIPWADLPGLWTWYHPPDPRYADPSVKAVLQFVAGEDGTIHYRSFAGGPTGTFAFENAGSTRKGEPRQRIWAGMGWKFQLTDYLSHAKLGPHFIPVPRRLGQEDADTVLVIRCRLTKNNSTEEFWLARTDDDMTIVHVGGEEFRVGYNSSQVTLAFTLKLLRAEQTTEKGSALPASQTSFVLLTDPDRGIRDQSEVITFNQPLSQRGYKFYQTGYKFLGVDAQGKPVNRSLLTVQHDPGLWLKYAGSSMLALGIGCMFYMRAYFFKYLRRAS